MFRNLLSVIVGLIASFIVIEVIEIIGYKMYPPTTNLNFNNPDSFREYISSAPNSVFLLVILGYALGSLAGGFVASVIAKQNKYTKAITVGGILMGLGVFNLFNIPHPLWVIIFALIVFLPFAYFGGKLGIKVSTKRK
jgi:ABC-type Na+ efflux pump permease subunit